MTEQWLPVAGYEGFYEVSDAGRVRSVDRLDSRGHRRRGKVLAQAKGNRHGHLAVALCAQGEMRTRYVHQLVLGAFVGERPEGMEACHGNDNPADNRAENLRWDTRLANVRDSLRNGNNHNARKTHCPQGHAYTEDNIYQHPSKGGRICRQCRRTQPEGVAE